MTRFQIPPLAGGLSEATSEAVQPPGTYIDGENVRGVDPRSGRQMWGAQRPGLVKVGEESVGSGELPTHLFETDRLVLRERWTNLTTTPAAATSPDSVKLEWSTNLDQGQVLDVAQSLEGVAYYLLDTGEVVLVGAGGAVSERIPSSVPAGFRPVPRIAVDSTGGVFVAATRDQATDDLTTVSVMARLEKDDADVWIERWSTEFESRMTLFGYGNGHLYAVLDPPEPEEGERPPAELVRFAAPLATGTVAWTRGPVPRPTFDVTVGRGGSCLLSHPSSPVRYLVDGTAFAVRSVTWTPHNLPAPQDQLFSWVEADWVNDSESPPEDGASVVVMNDRRKKPNPYVEIGGPDRELRKPVGQVFAAPTWDADAFGGLGGVKFTAQSCLRSGRNTGTADEDQLALVPAEGGWGIVFVVQLDPAAIAAAVLSYCVSQYTTAASQLNLRTVLTGAVMQWYDDATAVGTTGADFAAASPGGSNAAVVSIRYDAAGTAPVVKINGTTLALGGAWANDDSWGEYTIGGYAGATVPGPQTVLGEGNPNDRDFLSLPTVTITGGTTAAGQTLQHVVDDNVATRVMMLHDGTTTYAYLVFDLGSAFTGGDTLVLATTASEVTVEMGAAAPAGTPPVIGAPSFSQTFDLTVIANRRDHGGGLYGYDLRLPAAAALACRYLVLRFEPPSGNTAVIVADVKLKAQDLNRAAIAPVAFTLWGWCCLKPATVGNLTNVENYFALKVGLWHEYGVAPTVPAISGEPVDAGVVREIMRSPYPLLVKWGTDGNPLAAVASAGVGLGAVVSGDFVMTWGEPDPFGTGAAPNAGKIGARFEDLGRALDDVWFIAAGTEIPLVAPTRLATGPCSSLFVPFRPGPSSTGSAGVRRYTSAGAPSWALASALLPVAVATGGFLIDESATGGACGPEFLFLATVGGPRAHRVAVTGRLDTGVPDEVVVSRFAVTGSGNILRLAADGASWATVASGVLAGPRPWSARIYGLTILGDGRTYRVYDEQNDTLRDFAASVKGYLPPRAKLALAHRGRLYLAAADNPFALYGSRYGDVFDWDLGPIIEDVAQAVAGTTSSQGQVPERITALMPLTDDVLLIGTSRQLYALTGDLGEGGRLDVVDRSNGVAFGYAWCVGSLGLYYFSASGGVWLRGPDGARLVSANRVQRRLEDIDQRVYLLEMGYRWQDRTVHLFVVPLQGYQADLQHFVFEESTGAWHIDRFAGGVGRQVTCAATLRGAASQERTLALGFADGYVRELAGWAEDDDGIAIGSRATIGPLMPPADEREGQIRGIYGQLASDQGPLEVGVRAGDAIDQPGPVSERGVLEPGRGLGVTCRGAGAALFVEVRGMGRAWAAHQLEADAMLQGEKGARR